MSLLSQAFKDALNFTQMRNSSNSRCGPEVETLLRTTPSYSDMITKFCPFYSSGVSKQYDRVNEP